MLLLLAAFFAKTSAYTLTCHCLNGTGCHDNGYCELGCEKGWYGPGCQIGNVALGKAAKQSSTYYDEWNDWYNASLAVDGKMAGPYASSCSHTVPLSAWVVAWWSVVLDTAQYYVITNITIVNRNEEGVPEVPKRLTRFKILYTNETDGYPDPSNSIWHECAEENGTVGTRKTYTCKNMAIAKKVAIHLKSDARHNPDTILTLCEVQVYGYQHYVCPSGYTGPGCLLRSCDQCHSTFGQCSGDHGSCAYNVCPRPFLLPPECWIRLTSTSRALEDNSYVLGGSIGGSVTVIGITATIVVFLCYRRQRCGKSAKQRTSQASNAKSHSPTCTKDETKLPSSCKEQVENPYESLNMDLGMQTTGDYASLKYSI